MKSNIWTVAALPVVLLAGLRACDSRSLSGTDKQPHASSRSQLDLEFTPVMEVPATGATSRIDFKKEVKPDALEREIEFLRKQFVELDVKHLDLEAAVESRTTAKLNLLGKGFASVDSGVGTLLVSCEGAEPYLNGHKLKLKIGNPLTATIAAFHIKCRYGLKEPDYWAYIADRKAHDNEMRTYQKSIRTNEVDLTQTLKPGSWTPIDLELVPSKVEELGYIALEMQVTTVQLKEETTGR